LLPGGTSWWPFQGFFVVSPYLTFLLVMLAFETLFMLYLMKNWLVLGDEGRPGINFRVGYTWGPSGYPEFLQKVLKPQKSHAQI
jgi:hypothetical protein